MWRHSTECWCWTGISNVVSENTRTGGTEDQMVETERGEPKVTVYGGAGRKEIVGECSTGMVGGKQQI